MFKKKCSIITGVYGQDGFFLAEYLVSKGHHVIGLVNKNNKTLCPEMVQVVEIDIFETDSLKNLFLKENPDECYHLAAVHHSSELETSLDYRMNMLKVNFITTEKITDAIVKYSPKCKLLFAGSSQMYSSTHGIMLVDESTPFNPSSYYGITKVAGSQYINMMRNKNAIWASTAILFNHESPRRRKEFLSRKITAYVAEIYKLKNNNNNSLSNIKKLEIKNINSLIDWSSSKDIIRAMYLILQNDHPYDYVLGSGNIYSVRNFLEIAFNFVGLNWRDYVNISNDNNHILSGLQSNPELARKTLDWNSEYSFSSMIHEMIQYDIDN